MVRVNEATKIYNEGTPSEVRALDGLSVEVNDGEMIAVMGRSGSGKSTLLHILAGLDTLTSGSYILDAIDVGNLGDRQLAKLRAEKIGILLQDFALIEQENALKNVMVPLYFGKTNRRDMKKRAMLALERVGMDKQKNQRVNTLSGGQKQRVALARALVHSPKLLLADEPTGALDSKTTTEMLGLLKEINHGGMTMVIVTHDHLVSDACSRCIEIADGR